jgi:UDP:flavonoid glycosyltransferase YjiC (YdhE family)
MRVLMSALPSMGHVNPCLGLARGLQEAGHEVRLATAPGLAGHIRAAGVTPLNMGFDLIRPGDKLTPRLEERLQRWLMGSFGFWVDDLREHAEDWRPDVLVHDWSEVAGVVVARRLEIPAAILGVELRPPLARISDSLCWLGFDFEELGGQAAVFGDVLLDLYPPSFALPGDGRLDNEQFIQHPHYDGGAGREPPGWLDTTDPRPLVYATMGTYYGQVPEILDCVFEAVSGLDVRLVATIGRDGDPSQYEPLPANVRVERYVPQSLLIPHCAAVVCQGGINAMLAALGQGVPVACLPVPWRWSADLDGGARCARLGAGLVYPAAGEPDGRLDPGRVRAMLAAVLDDPAYRQGAQRIAAEIASLPDVHHAVKLIEEIAA